MIEIDSIGREAAALRARGVPFLLATVVRVSGSAYRRPGARMLIADHGSCAGTPGRWPERDVLLRGAFRSDAPLLVTYDSTSDEDIRSVFGLGRGSVVEVLLERIDEGTKLDPTRFVEACFIAEQTGALVTVFASADGSVPVGAKIAVRQGRVLASTVPPGEAYEAFLRDALANDPPGARVLTHFGVTALVERLVPPPHLFVAGTYDDAVPLVALARTLGMRVTVADAFATASVRARFALADRLFFGAPDGLARLVHAHACAAVVLMTHDFERDRDFLAALLRTRARYLGVLGPPERTARLLAAIGAPLTDELLARLHAPVGLDLGAHAPPQVALAILAEIQAALAGASALPLRLRSGPIPLRSEPNEEVAQ